MKKFHNRIMAIICSVIMIAGCVFTEVGPVAKAGTTQTEWLLRSGHNTNWIWYQLGNTAIQYGITDGAETPGAGMKYAELSEFPEGMFGFENSDFTAEIPNNYEPSDLNLTFWVWSSEASTMSGEIWMSSSGGVNNNFIAWQFSDARYADIIQLRAGWNQIRLPMDSYSGYSHTWLDEGIDMSSINWLRWHNMTVEDGVTYRLSDIKIVAKTQMKEWTILPAGGQMNAAIAHAPTDDALYGLSGTTGAVTEDVGGLAVGTTYSSTMIPAYDNTLGKGGSFGLNPGYMGTYGMSHPEISDLYTQNDLKLAFWFYSSTGGALPNGGIGLSSAGWKGSDEIRWIVSGMSMKQGWNYIELPLNDYDYSWGTFDYQNINYVHWYSDGNYLTEDTEYRLTDIKLIAVSKEQEATKTNYLVGTIPFTLDKTIEGNGASTAGISGSTTFTAIDASGRNLENLQLLMDVEIENLTSPGDLSDFGLFTGQIELTSSGTCDVNELSTMVTALNWRDGKQEYALDLTNFSQSGGNIDYSAINYMRIYINGWQENFSDDFRIKIDNVRLVDTTEQVKILPNLFSNGMIFQQNKDMNLWGHGLANETVVAKLYKGDELIETKSATVDANGDWALAFTARQGSYDFYSIDVTVGQANKVIKEVVIGELWIAGGQSNMELAVAKDMDSEKILSEANYPYIRIFLEPTYPFGSTGEQLLDPADDVKGAYWGYGNCGAAVSKTSSVAFAFAKQLQEELQVPVGIINSAIGGTRIEGWLSREAIEEDVEVKSILQEYGQYYSASNWPTQAGKMSTLYNQKIGPLEGMNVAGVIWYQGESNSNWAEIYDVELDLLKRSWSKVFGYENGDMPFVFTQVAPYRTDNGIVNNQHYGYLAMYMERGWKLSEDKNTAMLTVYDLPLEHVKNGVSTNPIHPSTKTPVGNRFATSALNMVYGGGKEYTAPVYKSMEVKEQAIYITFNRVGEGLKTIDSTKNVHGFTIAGEDGVYVNAQAEIVDKDTVKVWSDYLTNPVHAMYAFDNFNQGANLSNSSNIPASPFRTVSLNDNTYQPDSSISYFTAQDWMYADKDVWVYDSTYTENANMGTGYRPSFEVTGGSYTYNSEKLVEGTAALQVNYDGDFSVSPILSYESLKQDWSKFKNFTVQTMNPTDKDLLIKLVIKSGNKTYTVETLDGEGAVTLESGVKFQVLTYDLTTIKENGVQVANAVEILAGLTEITFQVEAEGTGQLYMDAFAVGMTDPIPVEEENPSEEESVTPPLQGDDEEVEEEKNQEEDTSQKEEKPQIDKDQTVNTGDYSYMGWYMSLLIFAGVVALLASKRIKREE